MPRFKSNKEYAIRITHEQFGELYLSRENIIYEYKNNSYSNWYGGYKVSITKFIFTKSLSKVKTWKTLKLAEEKSNSIINTINTNQKNKIYLDFGKTPNTTEDVKRLLICERLKYFLIITKLVNSNSSQRNKIDSNLSKQHVKLVKDANLIAETIKNSEFINGNFHNSIEKLKTDVIKYTQDYEKFEKSKLSENITFDIIDASYNFRLVKLKRLNIKS
jgi:hypothetical protein